MIYTQGGIALENDIIKFKGTGDGVKIQLGSECDFSEIVDTLRRRLDEFRKFFGSGHCNIYFTGRRLEKSDMLRLEAVVTSMLPESSIYYGEKRKVRYETADIIQASIERKENSRETEELEDIRNAAANNFKSSRARFYEGSVKSGKIIDSDGHLILMGDVEKGATVAAVGNIIIIGGLYGTAEAGCLGNKGAYITALDFNPEKASIAGTAKYDYKYEGSGMRKAVLTDNQIYTYEYLVK